MANKLKLSLSPHVHSGDSVSKNMRWVIIAMLPAMLWSFYAFGLGAVIVTAVSVASCVFFEWAINKYILKNDKCTLCDYSAVVTGILLAFNLPSNLPLYIIIIGALFAIGVVKMTFGGLGCNLFNPALAARVFLLISFPVKMTTWPEVGQMTAYADAVTAATPMANLAQTNLCDLFFGNVGGSLGEVSALCLLIGLVILLASRTITWHIPVSILVTVFALSGLLHIAYPVEVATPWHHLFGGGLMLGAIFMATDYVTSPMTAKGQLIYGFCIGFLTVAIRVFGAYPEGMSFAILIMNAFVPLINNACKPKRFAKEVIESSLKNMLLVLTTVSVVATFLLAYVNNITSSTIEKINEEALNSGIKSVLDIGADDAIETTEKTVDDYVVYEVSRDGNWVGTAVKSTDKSGFGGDIVVLVGFDADGNIQGYEVLSHAETPGLGARMGEWFRTATTGDTKEVGALSKIFFGTPDPAGSHNIIGRNIGNGELKVTKDGGDIDAITASTITSRAFLNAVNNAYKVYKGNVSDVNSSATSQQ